MDDVYLGPYTVAEVVDKGRYRLQNQSGKKLKKLYNGVLLKEHFPSQPDADLQENSTQVQKPDEKPSKPCMPKRARLGGRKRQQSSCSLPASKKRKV